jgi:hypothetical protein
VTALRKEWEAFWTTASVSVFGGEGSLKRDQRAKIVRSSYRKNKDHRSAFEFIITKGMDLNTNGITF